MKILNKIRYFACLGLLISGNLLFSTSNTFAYSINKDFKSMPEGSYQIARSIFLPDAKDEVWLPKGNYNKSECDKLGYPLKDCPEHGVCSPCPINSSYYKLNSCKNDGDTKYVVNSSKTGCEPRCDVVACTGYTYNNISDIPEGWNYEKCLSVADSCATAWKYKKGTTCKDGYYKKNNECLKECSSQQCTSLYSGKTIIDNKSEFYDTSIAEFTYLGKGKTYTCEDVDCYSFIRCKYPYTKGSGAHCYCQTETCGSEYNFSSSPSNAYYEDCTEIKSLNGKCTASKKYKITSCHEGYHLDGFCQKDCVPGTNAGAGTYDIKQFPYESKEECETQGNAKSCMGISFYTDKLCNTKLRYTVRACKEGYTAKKTDNGTICEKEAPQCEIEICDGYDLTTYPSNLPNGYTVETCQIVNADCSKGISKYKIIAPVCEKEYILDPNSGKCIPGIGSILYSDLTTGVSSDYANQKAAGKTAIGVVFDPINTKAISLNTFSAKWEDIFIVSEEHSDIPELPNVSEGEVWANISGTGLRNGKENTQIINNFKNLTGKKLLAASMAAGQYTAGTHAGDWYLPAIGELYDILDNRLILENTLTLVGGKKFPVITGEQTEFHWSSTEQGRDFAWYAFVAANSKGTESGYNNINKYSNAYVRSVIDYSDLRYNVSCTEDAERLKKEKENWDTTIPNSISFCEVGCSNCNQYSQNRNCTQSRSVLSDKILEHNAQCPDNKISTILAPCPTQGLCKTGPTSICNLCTK